MKKKKNASTEKTVSTGGSEAPQLSQTPPSQTGSLLPTGATTAKSGTSASNSITDKRSSSGRKAILNEPSSYKVTQNRLSNVRWAVGEEPYHDVEGTHKDDPTVNVKLEVVEHPDPDPNQRNLLGSGPELRIKCFTCGAPMHVAAAKTAREVLEEGKYVLKDDVDNADQVVLACVCNNGHLMQLRKDYAMGLLKHEN